MARRCVPNKKPAWWPEAPRSGPTLVSDPNGLENRLSRAMPPKRVQELRGASSTIYVTACLYHRINDLSFLWHAGAQPLAYDSAGLELRPKL